MLYHKSNKSTRGFYVLVEFQVTVQPMFWTKNAKIRKLLPF